MSEHAWRTVQMLGVCGLLVSPFWFLAGRLDADEFIKTGMGAGMAGVAVAVKAMFFKGKDA